MNDEPEDSELGEPVELGTASEATRATGLGPSDNDLGPGYQPDT